MKLPQSIPILTAFSARVAGVEMADLLSSPVRLARALADTQAVIGHDGVLCLFDPWLLPSACMGENGPAVRREASVETPLTPPGELLQRPPVSTLLETMQPLRHSLPDDVKIYAAFSGPGLLSARLRDALAVNGGTEAGYVREVMRGLVRSFLDLKADGIALIERSGGKVSPESTASYRVVRKLAEFYDAGYVVFDLAAGERRDNDFNAQCVFDLPAATGEIGPVTGRSWPAEAAGGPPRTSAGDVPGDTPVEVLKTLFAHAGR